MAKNNTRVRWVNLFLSNKWMKFFMTKNTHGNYIKPMFSLIPLMVMILFCLFSTRTLKIINAKKFTCYDSIIYSIFSFAFLWIVLAVFYRSQLFDFFTFFGLTVLFLGTTAYYFARFGLLVSLHYNIGATFAMRPKTIFTSFLFVKFSQWFDFFASETLFCYSWFRHGFFLTKKLCFEPLESQSLCGSFYINRKTGFVK